MPTVSADSVMHVILYLPASTIDKHQNEQRHNTYDDVHNQSCYPQLLSHYLISGITMKTFLVFRHLQTVNVTQGRKNQMMQQQF